MSTRTLQGDEVLDQVLEDEREAALKKFRELEEVTIDATDLSDA